VDGRVLAAAFSARAGIVICGKEVRTPYNLRWVCVMLLWTVNGLFTFFWGVGFSLPLMPTVISAAPIMKRGNYILLRPNSKYSSDVTGWI